MAGRGGRGKEVALQVDVESQEDWEEAIGKEGVTVVDVYQEWCGPCKAMLSNFKRIKNEIGDDLLHFANAKADAIESLERYRGKCEPCFLFYASGVLVAVVRGANTPMLSRVITDQLAHEHKVLEGSAERKEIRDPKFPHSEEKRTTKVGPGVDLDESSSSESEDDDEDERRSDSEMMMNGERVFLGQPEASTVSGKVLMEKMYTVAIFEPDIVSDSNKMDEILEKLEWRGIEILESTKRQLTVDEAKHIFASQSSEETFDEMCTFLSSGECQILVLTKGDFGDGIVDEWQEIMGPATILEAKEQAPDSLRAVYGNAGNPVARAFRGSSTIKDAKRELRFFFADFVVPKVSLTHIKPVQEERTLAIIRPDILAEHRDEILQKIDEAHFKIAMQREVQLEKEQVEEFLKDQPFEANHEELVTRMSSGPLLVLVLEKEDAIEAWKAMLGPKEVDIAQIEAPDSLRAVYAVPDVPINQLHGSESEEQFVKEMTYFFPLQHTVAVIKPDGYHTREMLMLKIREAGFNIVAHKDVVLTKEMAEELYENCRDKEYFADLIEFMTSGPTSYLILSRNGAVAGWKQYIGPTDPEEAKEHFPKSLRAKFGTDVLQNAVHGPSDEHSATEHLRIIFGEVEFDFEGNIKKKKKPKKIVEEEPCPEDEANTGDATAADDDEGEEEMTEDGGPFARETAGDEEMAGEEERMDNDADAGEAGTDERPDDDNEHDREQESNEDGMQEPLDGDDQTDQEGQTPKEEEPATDAVDKDERKHDDDVGKEDNITDDQKQSHVEHHDEHKDDGNEHETDNQHKPDEHHAEGEAAEEEKKEEEHHDEQETEKKDED